MEFAKRTRSLALVALCFSACATRPDPSDREVAANDGVRAPTGHAWVCSFNVQWVGFSNDRDDAALAKLMKDEDCEVVVVQEIVAPHSEEWLGAGMDADFIPPNQNGKFFYPTKGPGGKLVPMKTQPKTTAFFDAMYKAGYVQYVLSPEDTGPNKFQTNSTESEYFAVFARGQSLTYASDLPKGFLAAPLVKNRTFDRVPFAFPFRTKKGFDFVLLSVHLAADANKGARRATELEGIENWIRRATTQTGERDYIILGDMNIENEAEMNRLLPTRDWVSLNEACEATNTAKVPKPYDHIFLSRRETTAREVPLKLPGRGDTNFAVVDLHGKMEAAWRRKNPGKPFPGGELQNGERVGYDHTAFRLAYSDHKPIKFLISLSSTDDDGR